MSYLTKYFSKVVKVPDVDNEAVEEKIIENVYKKFTVGEKETLDSEIKSAEIVYCIIQLNKNNIMNINKLHSVISNIVTIAIQTNGDVQSFFSDTLPIIYGVPFPNENRISDVNKFIQKIDEINDEFKVIVGRDTALWGVFGTDNRKLVSVISEKLIDDFHKLNSLPDSSICIQKELEREFACISQLNNLSLYKK